MKYLQLWKFDFNANDSFFKNTFFQCTIVEWNILNSNIRCFNFYELFRKQIIELIRPQPSSIFDAPI